MTSVTLAPTNNPAKTDTAIARPQHLKLEHGGEQAGVETRMEEQQLQRPKWSQESPAPGPLALEHLDDLDNHTSDMKDDPPFTDHWLSNCVLTPTLAVSSGTTTPFSMGQPGFTSITSITAATTRFKHAVDVKHDMQPNTSSATSREHDKLAARFPGFHMAYTFHALQQLQQQMLQSASPRSARTPSTSTSSVNLDGSDFSVATVGGVDLIFPGGTYPPPDTTSLTSSCVGMVSPSIGRLENATAMPSEKSLRSEIHYLKRKRAFIHPLLRQIPDGHNEDDCDFYDDVEDEEEAAEEEEEEEEEEEVEQGRRVDSVPVSSSTITGRTSQPPPLKRARATLTGPGRAPTEMPGVEERKSAEANSASDGDLFHCRYPGCSRAYVHKRNRNAHETAHTKVGVPLLCTVCGDKSEKFKTRHYLDMHRRTCHPELPSRPRPRRQKKLLGFGSPRGSRQ